jgi:hypothetical protein
MPSFSPSSLAHHPSWVLEGERERVVSVRARLQPLITGLARGYVTGADTPVMIHLLPHSLSLIEGLCLCLVSPSPSSPLSLSVASAGRE